MTNLERAEAAYAAIHSQNGDQAKEIVMAGLAVSPNDPDLLCALGILDCFQQRESNAAKAYTRTTGAARREELATILRDHYRCRLAIDPNDADAKVEFGRFNRETSTPENVAGVSVSAILIVRDEERHLDRCLESVKPYVDQIVVVDTGSTDRTVEIAESFGATIGRFDWIQDYSAARNESLRLATGDWALWIDADEEFDARAASALRQAIVRPHFGGFYTEIVNFTEDGDRSNEFVHTAIRLFRNVPGVRFTERIHEQVGPSLADLGLVTATIEGPFLRHHGYRPSEIEAKGKIDKTVALLEAVVRDQPDDPFQWFNLANAHLIAKRYEESAFAAERAVSLLTETKDYGALAYQVWANALSMNQDVEGCLRACDLCDAAGYGGILNEFERASVLAKASRFVEALAAIDRCVAAAWPKSKTGDRGIFTHKRHILRGQILASMGRFIEAHRSLDVALNVMPDEPTAIYWKAVTYERSGDYVQAKSWFKRGLVIPGLRELAQEGVARCLVAHGDAGAAQSAYRERWESDPTNIEKWDAWATTCQANRDTAEVLEAYDELAKVVEPTGAILINWGRALSEAGELSKALDCFAEAIRRDPENANAYFNCGDLLYRGGAYLDAAHLYESGLRREPRNAEAWFTLGNSLAQLDIAEGAVTSYRQALALDPMHERARHNLSIVLAESQATAA